MIMIEIYTVGGYNEVGKNMTLINVDGEAVILDMGIHLEPYIKLTEEAEDIITISPKHLIKAGAIPDINLIKHLMPNVKAIIPSHAHLDHIGAIPFIAKKFDAPVIGTPYTISVLSYILKEERIKFDNPLKSLNPNSFYKISDTLKIEFINMTHSTPQTVAIAVHTKYGIILYTNDFKLDLYPTLGSKPNFKR